MYCHKDDVMKKIIFILILAFTVTEAKPCMTDIYFGNGVWNTPTQASKSLRRLRRFMKTNYNAQLERDKEGQIYQFMPPMYNPSRGTIEDLLETFWQLKESGQIDEGYFMSKWNLLTANRGPTELRKAINRVATTNTVDVNRMYNTYNNTSFSKKHNVLLVAHSQGNLFGNKIYTMFTDAQKNKFRMVSVGTPANHVMEPNQIAPYVTARDDFVINRISGALAGNVEGFGHTFIGTYLGSSFEARTNIAQHVKSAYENLMKSSTCGGYAFTRIWMRTFGLLNVYGDIDGEDELVGKITLEQSDAILNDDNRTYRCTEKADSVYGGEDNYIGINWTSNYEDDKYNSWIPGQYITSRSYLDDVSDINDSVLKDTKCVTISLNKDGDLYNMIYDMFPE